MHVTSTCLLITVYRVDIDANGVITIHGASTQQSGILQ